MVALPHALEQSDSRFCRHHAFGDSTSIHQRVVALYGLALEVLADELPAVRSLQQIVATAPKPHAQRILSDAVVRAAIDTALEHLRARRLEPGGEAEELLSAAAQGLTGTGAPVSPLELRLGAPPRLEGGAGAEPVWIWCDPVQNDVVTARFRSAAETELSGEERRAAVDFVPVDEAVAQVLIEGHALLLELVPYTARSALSHIQGIVVAEVEADDATFQNATFQSVPGVVFLSPDRIQTPWSAAESLLHESLHHKFFDLVRTRAIYRPGFRTRTAQKVSPPWHRRPTSLAGVAWSADRALGAFHVYAHLAAVTRGLDHLPETVLRRFGSPDLADRGTLLPNAPERAGFLGEALLTEAATDLGPDGRRFVEWLLETGARPPGAALEGEGAAGEPALART